ncbi:MAG: hypothetical protein AAF597_03050, partial [Bacteroidota bacterium]
MRHLILLFAFLATASTLTAQCDVTVNFLTAQCGDDGNTFTVTFTAESSVEGDWQIPNLNTSGTFNTGEEVTIGPFSETQANGSFFIVHQGFDSCFAQVSFPEIACEDPCFGFNFWAQQQEISCGPNGESFVYVEWQTPSYPVIVDLLQDGGQLFQTDTFQEGSFFETIVFNWEVFTVRLTNGDGCVEEQVLDPLFQNCANISGRSWLDENEDGVRDNETIIVPGLV